MKKTYFIALVFGTLIHSRAFAFSDKLALALKLTTMRCDDSVVNGSLQNCTDGTPTSVNAEFTFSKCKETQGVKTCTSARTFSMQREGANSDVTVVISRIDTQGVVKYRAIVLLLPGLNVFKQSIATASFSDEFPLDLSLTAASFTPIGDTHLFVPSVQIVSAPVQ